MSDYISRQAVNTLVDELARAISDERCFMSRGRSTGEIMSDILNLPSVENKGEWIKIQSGDKDFPESIVCSVCGGENSYLDFGIGTEPIAKSFVKSKYCPNCGARMKGGE